MHKLKYILLILLPLQLIAQGNSEKLSYHLIQTDEKGKLLSWVDKDPGRSYDHIVRIVWDFWKNMRTDYNGLPYYMNHQVWARDHNDARGIGGDQIAMALSSWRLLYAYTGDDKILENIRFLADYYLSHSLTSADCVWKNLPYPYNTLVYSGIYDGDMIMGKGYVQPDKAGSFGEELVNVYKITGRSVYLDAAVAIANCLAEQIVPGDKDHSPFPYRVNALTGKTGTNKEVNGGELTYSYTTNWVGTMQLLNDLVLLGKDDQTGAYQRSFRILLNWMQAFPLKTNKWGPFFEDVAVWSDTQINAVTYAQFILEHPELFPDWKTASRHILDWVYNELGNNKWEKLGVAVVNEQTSYRVPGNSHTARQGATELLYASRTGDQTAYERGIRQLNWATYMVNEDGESTYPNNETWMTDGYGDYVRHYLRGMAAFPAIAPDNQDHLVSSTSVVKRITYQADEIKYDTFDANSSEVLRLKRKPKEIKAGGIPLSEHDDNGSWSWVTEKNGGVLMVNHVKYNKIAISF